VAGPASQWRPCDARGRLAARVRGGVRHPVVTKYRPTTTAPDLSYEARGGSKSLRGESSPLRLQSHWHAHNVSREPAPPVHLTPCGRAHRERGHTPCEGLDAPAASLLFADRNFTRPLLIPGANQPYRGLPETYCISNPTSDESPVTLVSRRPRCPSPSPGPGASTTSSAHRPPSGPHRSEGPSTRRIIGP
jgi:hypothetical protein